MPTPADGVGMSLLDVVRASRLPGVPVPRAPQDEATGLDGRGAFETTLARAVDRTDPGRLTLALFALGGFDRAALDSGRRWAEALVVRAAAVLTTVTGCDNALTGYRVGALTFALVFERTEEQRAFTVAEAIGHRIERDAAPLTCATGVATWDGVRTADAETLELAADAALDQAELLGRARSAGRVVAAADQTSGLRWIASSPSSTRSAAR